MRELVQDPRKTVSTRMSFMGVPASKPMYCRARSAAALAFSSPKSSGDGTLADSDTPWPGLVPPGHERFERIGVQVNLDVESCVRVRVERVPVLDGGIPVCAFRRVGGRPCM